VCGAAQASTNIALGGTASQSSTLGGIPTGAASAAIDGNTDGNFYNASVTHTNLETSPWWQVDLRSVSQVDSVTVWNRTDCCALRLTDYWVFVSNVPFLASDTPTTLANRPNTISSHQTSAPNPSVTIAVNGQGRYVRVQLSGAGNLSLAEVQVTGTGAVPTNIAIGKSATQSSTLLGYSWAVASSAVDGSTNGDFFQQSVTHTQADVNAWWQVDLGGAATVNSVIIWNRTDCCTTRLSDYWVFVSNTPFQPTDTPTSLLGRANTYSNHQTTTPSPFTTINPGTQGRYVRVQLTGIGNLSLAELQVIGTGGGDALPPTNLAMGKSALQSSTLSGYPSAIAGSAVDGNVDGGFFNGSVTHTNPEPNPWWQVDLGITTIVTNVVVWNRTDCCVSRLSDYYVFVSDTPFQAFDTPATLQVRANTFVSHQSQSPNPSTTIPVNQSGRYVRIQLNTGNPLSLAEVQVYGATPVSNQSSVLFQDNFVTAAVQPNRSDWTTDPTDQVTDWTSPEGVGRFSIGNKGAQLSVSTFNPSGAGVTGTHARTVKSFSPTENTTIVYNARLQLTSMQAGLVYGIYLKGQQGKIGIEFASGMVRLTGKSEPVNLPDGFDALAAHDWTIKWSLSRVDYFVDGQLLGSSTEQVPQTAMHANVIALAAEEGGALQPASSSALNQTFTALLRSVTVSSIAY